MTDAPTPPLLPCPFGCGPGSIIQLPTRGTDEYPQGENAVVGCKVCGCAQRCSWGHISPLSKAIEYWNQRSSPDPLRELRGFIATEKAKALEAIKLGEKMFNTDRVTANLIIDGNVGIQTGLNLVLEWLEREGGGTNG